MAYVVIRCSYDMELVNQLCCGCYSTYKYRDKFLDVGIKVVNWTSLSWSCERRQ